MTLPESCFKRKFGVSAAAGRHQAPRKDASRRYAGRVSTAPVTPELARAEGLIREIPGYPEPGILFRDITPLLADGPAFHATIEALVAPFAGQFDVVAGIEARGFLLAAAAAVVTGTGIVPVRKAGKLPQPAMSIDYSLEYGTATIEMHADLEPGTRVLVIDDVLATGGTVAATLEMLEHLGYPVCGVSVLFEIEGMAGRARVSDHALHTVFGNANEVA